LLFTVGRGAFGGLSEEDAGRDPFTLFGRWFDDARRAKIYLHETVCLATATPDGAPSARMMLLKGFDERGFRFYTNYGSRKAAQLEENSKAALVLHWSILHRQIRIQGSVERLSEEESAEYFRTRPRGSQLGAWASRQSSELEGRSELEEAYREYESEFESKEVPLPPFWGGYRLKPDRIEFWQGRANRLHDRLVYIREDSAWNVIRLAP
jgi:pyridoxamine 5'-phosphate oxidase